MTMAELKEKRTSLQKAGKGRVEWGPYDVEYHKKVAIPAACVVFGLLGLGLSLGSKKEARSAAFGLSIGVIFTYYVIIRLGEQAGDTGLVPPVVAMWAANFVLGAIAVALLVANHRAAAFDPLDPSHYLALVPRVRRGPPKPGRPRPPRQGPRPRGVVVLRIPRFNLHLPGILDRYIARTYVGHFLMVLVAFWSISMLVNFMDLFDDVQRNRIKGALVVHYYAFATPAMIHLMAPVAVLMAVLITFGVMSRRNEITAMKAAGISVYRASVPMLALAVLVCLFLFGLSELVLPSMNKVANQDRNVIKGRPPQSTSSLERRWILGSDGRFYNYDYLERGTGIALYGLAVFDVDPLRWDLRNRLYAARAAWNGVSYDLERGWYRSFAATPTFHTFDQTRVRDIEPPSYFNQEERESDTLGFKELRRHISSLEKLGLDVTKLRVELYRKVSFPLVTVVMTLIGIPFAFVVARHGALYGIAAAIVIAIFYWGCLAIFEALGSTAVLPPALASWAPNILFGAAGLYLMLTLET
jgi:LPS export ABC transporter permease LptG